VEHDDATVLLYWHWSGHNWFTIVKLQIMVWHNHCIGDAVKPVMWCVRNISRLHVLHRLSRYVHATSVKQKSAKGMLVRDYIHKSLYDSEHGYFSAQRPLIITSDVPMTQFRNQLAYQKYVAKLYEENPSCWITPVELFNVQWLFACCCLTLIASL